MRKPEERRKFTRYAIPLKMAYIVDGENLVYKSTTKNISSLGISFESIKKLPEGADLELKLEIPKAPNPVHAIGKLVWVRKQTLEDSAPFDIGLEFQRIEEDNKNTFLKFMCDLAYKYGHK
ncbi:MAG: PilZ domain-containing protein [Candidatus Omnitrophica bacterium]|nr:PilZ domain-containing protein [Candidatus Omnitrophota bacterium]